MRLVQRPLDDMRMTSAHAVACIAVPAITFSLIGAPGLLVAACIAPGVLVLWILDRTHARRGQATGLPTAAVIATIAPAEANVASTTTAGPRLTAATKLAEQEPAGENSPTWMRPPSAAATKPTEQPNPHSPLPQRKRLHPPKAEADHFRRHEHTPGWLYAARNSHHRDDLHKLGYTTVAPDQRINTLNEEHDSRTHVGSFEPVHVVPVESAYKSEQRLFQVLSAYRVAAKREFFLVQKNYLLRAMDAVSRESLGLIPDALDWLAIMPAPTPENDAVAHEVAMAATIPTKPMGGGYLLIVRNPLHARHVYRLASTHLDPRAYLESANGVQRNQTSQIGFYALESVHAVTSPRTACAAVLHAAHGHRIGPGSFVRMALADLSMLVQSCLATESVAQQPPTPTALQTLTIDHLLAGDSWHDNTCPYADCFSNVRAAGAAGRTGELRCHECRRRVGYEIPVNGALVVWRDS
jgi:hypothetical protein